MNIEAITSTLIKQMLVAWQQAKAPPTQLLNLDMLHGFGGQSPAERYIYLHDWVYQTTLARLQQCREVEGRPSPHPEPQTRQQITAVLADDFSHNSVELEAWSALYHRYCSPISVSVNDLSQAASIVPRHFSRRVQTGLDLLGDVLRREEMEAHGRFRAQQRRRHLPPPDYAQLFGGEILLKQLADLFQQKNGPRMISIEGLGGIGKTALARAFANSLAETSDLEGIIWISARHAWLTDQGDLQPVADSARSLADIVARLADQLGQPDLAGLSVAEKVAQLQPVLSAAPHLVVIDNLETLEDVETLLPALAPLKETARFLLTSRHTLSRYPFVHSVTVQPLSLTGSRALVESELARRGRTLRLEAAAITQMHNIIGGVPLALKLTAAQLIHLPLGDVLTGLRHAKREPSENLYTFIYWRTWRLLDDPAKALLLSLLSVSPDGESVVWLRLMSDLPEGEFETALAQLVEFSLLEIAGSPAAPVYRMHRLTTTFLQTEVLLDWLT